jgi:hypothetical protein
MKNDEPVEPENKPGREVGLGRVVEDPLSIGRPEPDDPAAADERTVRKASEDSFPASDPPTWISDKATPTATEEPPRSAENQ